MQKKLAILLLAALLATSAQLATAKGNFDVVATVPDRPGNVAVSKTGRIFLTNSPFDNPKFKVVEVNKQGATEPFPDAERSEKYFAAPIAIRSTSEGLLYIFDMGSKDAPSRLSIWKLDDNSLVKEVPLPAGLTKSNSFLQDMAVDPARGMVYLADMTQGDLLGASAPAIIALNIKTGSAKRLLEDHPSMRGEKHVTVIDGRPMALKDDKGTVHNIILGLNPITIDAKGEWVYYSGVSNAGIYRIPAADLANPDASDEMLAAKVERRGNKRPSDGITIDNAGNVYFGDLERNAVSAVTPKGDIKTIAQSKEYLAWTDGFAWGPDGKLYGVVTQLHKMAVLNRGEFIPAKFYVVRMNGLAKGTLGR